MVENTINKSYYTADVEFSTVKGVAMNKGILLFGSAVLSMSILISCGGGGGGGGILPMPTPKPGAFDLISPTDGDNSSLTPTLSWTASSQASSYTVQIASSATFTPTILDTTVTASATNLLTAGTTTLGVGSNYYWRVSAKNSGGRTLATSGTKTFATFTARSGGGAEWAKVSPVAGVDAEAFAMAKDKSNVWVAGYNETASMCGDVRCSQWRIEKRTVTDGSLITDFGSGGVINTPSTSEFDSISGLTISGPWLYAVGMDLDAGWRIEKRSLTDGSLDATFGSGTAAYSTPSLVYDTATAVAADATYLYVVGYSSDETFDNDVWKIEVRSLSSGATGTVISSTTGTGLNQANAIALDATNMYVAGFDSIPGNKRWRIEVRSLITGTLVDTFTNDANAGDDEITALAVDDTSIYLAGYETETAPNTKWRIEKRSKSNGALDAGFNDGVAISENPSPGDDMPTSIILDSAAGFMYIAGYQSFNEELGTGTWRIEKRDLNSGVLYSSFGNNGVVIVDPAANGNDTAWAIATDPENTIFIAGYDSAGGNKEWRLEKRTE
jgi:hypothetical protein